MKILISGDGSGKKKLINLILENKNNIKLELPNEQWDNKEYVHRLNKSIQNNKKGR